MSGEKTAIYSNVTGSQRTHANSRLRLQVNALNCSVTLPPSTSCEQRIQTVQQTIHQITLHKQYPTFASDVRG